MSKRIADPDELQETIATAVTDVGDVERMEREGLFEVIDLDALAELFARNADDKPRTTGLVAFEFAGCVITVHADGWVTVVPTEQIQNGGVPDPARETVIVSEDGFESGLGQLVRASYLNNIDVRGSWTLRASSDLPDWEVEISEVTKPVRGG